MGLGQPIIAAERLVANVEGVTTVNNQIELLPTSIYDDEIRLATMRALFSSNFLSKYAWFGSGSGLLGPGFAHIPYHSDIHILVKGGNVTLEGVVNSKTDKDVASILANGVSGAFSVTNNLSVKSSKTKEG